MVAVSQCKLIYTFLCLYKNILLKNHLSSQMSNYLLWNCGLKFLGLEFNYCLSIQVAAKTGFAKVILIDYIVSQFADNLQAFSCQAI